MRDIVIFEPTHTLRESGLLFSGCRPPAPTSRADVGSAKEQRGHPPGYTGLKFALHGHAGIG